MSRSERIILPHGEMRCDRCQLSGAFPGGTVDDLHYLMRRRVLEVLRETPNRSFSFHQEFRNCDHVIVLTGTGKVDHETGKRSGPFTKIWSDEDSAVYAAYEFNKRADRLAFLRKWADDLDAEKTADQEVSFVQFAGKQKQLLCLRLASEGRMAVWHPRRAMRSAWYAFAKKPVMIWDCDTRGCWLMNGEGRKIYVPFDEVSAADVEVPS